MPSVTIRFYEELNDFLSAPLRKTAWDARFADGCTVKALIEDLGVPHTEVDLVLANGDSVPFSQKLRDGDFLSVYPRFESLDITAVSRLRPAPLRRIRFVADVHLGKLARLLRMMGFDASYSPTATDEEIARLAEFESRTVLTRDRGLLKRRIVTRGYCVRSPYPPDQLAEILRRFDCAAQVVLFARCMSCNGPVRSEDASAVRDRLPDHIAATHREFSSCQDCGRVYWRGTHWERMKKLAAEVLSKTAGSRP